MNVFALSFQSAVTDGMYISGLYQFLDRVDCRESAMNMESLNGPGS